jgi:hypothetical protein
VINENQIFVGGSIPTGCKGEKHTMAEATMKSELFIRNIVEGDGGGNLKDVVL